MGKCFSILVLFSSFFVEAQSFQWWAQTVNWDGVSHWNKYIITAPAYMGPNALPVPFINTGSIDSIHSFSLTGNFHFSKGDKTQNAGIYANYCLVKNIISFDASWIPFEHYRMDHATKEKRHVFSHYYYNSRAVGDVHLNTNIQVLNKARNKMHVALRIGYRLPTSGDLGSARFTDAPGYYFDAGLTKPWGKKKEWKWLNMVGFYVWQTYRPEHRQDDAFLFGTGFEWNNLKWKMQSYFTGYFGYEDGDKPILLRGIIERKGKKFNPLLRLQQGLHDFDYTSAELGLRYVFGKN